MTQLNRISKQKDKELKESFCCSVWDLNEYEIKEYFKIKNKGEINTNGKRI